MPFPLRARPAKSFTSSGPSAASAAARSTALRSSRTFPGQPYWVSAANGASALGLDLKSQVEAVERLAILRALEASGGNRRQAASLLGISLRTLFYKMRRLPVHT